MNCKLHEFLGDEGEREALFQVYSEFFIRSRPLEFKYKTLSERTVKLHEHFQYLTSHTKIIFATQNEKMIGFIAFDIENKTLEIPDSLTQIIDPKKTCEFVFAASRDFDWLLFRDAVFGIFRLIRAKYNVTFIAGNVRRQHKQQAFIAIAKKLFRFKCVDNLAYHEISQSV